MGMAMISEEDHHRVSFKRIFHHVFHTMTIASFHVKEMIVRFLHAYSCSVSVSSSKKENLQHKCCAGGKEEHTLRDSNSRPSGP